MKDGEVRWEALAPRLQALTERLDHIERHLADVARKEGYHYAPFDSGLPAEVVELARAGKTLEAVKRYRAVTGASLDQARDAVAKAAAGGI
jgi:ribosomal protein L7/L12